MAKEEGLQAPVHQVLVYPMTDYGFDTPSYKEYAEAKPLNAPMMKWFFEQYLKDESEGSDPRISPLRADLAGLPSATIITAEVDPLRDDGHMYAEQLRAAGVTVEAKHFEGVTHEFFGMGAVVDKATEAVEFAAGQLRGAFAREGANSAA